MRPGAQPSVGFSRAPFRLLYYGEETEGC